MNLDERSQWSVSQSSKCLSKPRGLGKEPQLISSITSLVYGTASSESRLVGRGIMLLVDGPNQAKFAVTKEHVSLPASSTTALFDPGFFFLLLKKLRDICTT